MPTIPDLRLAFVAVYVRIFLIAFVLSEVTIWNKVRKVFPGAWKHRRVDALLYFTPQALVKSLLLAALITAALDLIVRLIARPAAGRWYEPIGTGSDATPIGFHLEPGERILAESPARRRSGRGWRPGTLILTERLLWFFPVTWDLEPLSIPLDELRSVRTEPYRPPFGSFVRGVPDRLTLRDAEGGRIEFALADPSAVRDWFARPELAGRLRPGLVERPHAYLATLSQGSNDA